MKEEKMTVRIAGDGTLRVETHGLKGKHCQAELEKLLAELAVVNEVTLTGEAREKDAEAHVARVVTVGKDTP